MNTERGFRAERGEAEAQKWVALATNIEGYKIEFIIKQLQE